MDAKKLSESTVSEGELKAVSGGDGQMQMTKMECNTCGLVTCMPGNLVGKSVPCTRYIEGAYCKGSLIGISSWWEDV